jgi:hypothetical protein
VSKDEKDNYQPNSLMGSTQSAKKGVKSKFQFWRPPFSYIIQSSFMTTVVDFYLISPFRPIMAKLIRFTPINPIISFNPTMPKLIRFTPINPFNPFNPN